MALPSVLYPKNEAEYRKQVKDNGVVNPTGVGLVPFRTRWTDIFGEPDANVYLGPDYMCLSHMGKLRENGNLAAYLSAISFPSSESEDMRTAISDLIGYLGDYGKETLMKYPEPLNDGEGNCSTSRYRI